MTEDIWDEKPNAVPAGTLNDMFQKVYFMEDMDAWLEKVKVEHDKAVVAADYLMEVSLKSGEKLEAVKNYLNELEGTGRFIDRQKIMNILEVEGGR